MTDNKNKLGPGCTPECAEFSTGDGECPGWTHPEIDFSDIHPDFDPPPMPTCTYKYRVKIRRGERWFDLGAYDDVEMAQKIAARWGTPGNALVSAE